ACAGFGAVCGSSLATASTMGKVALPELRRLNYSPRLATGTLAAGGTLGILIPPSVALVIYAVTVEASIIQMFQAAIIPGLLAVVFFMAVIAIQVRLNPSLAPIPEPMAPVERREALLRLIPVMVIFGSIILGLGAGLFTPTPAAGVGVFAILVYGAYMRLRGKGGLTFSGLKQSLRDTAVTTSMIFFILLGAEILKGFFSRANLPAYMAEAAATSGLDPWLIMVLMLLALIVLGCFMESLSMIVVIIPFFWPALVDINGGDWATAATAAYGMGAEDLKIWFGILALIVVELGLITPPVGLNVFIINALADGVPMSQTFRGVMPFFAAEIVRIMLLIFVPVLTLFVPTLLGG
ncbi:TRAP transporter large permease, partial [Thalassospira sp.]|uniref:TRAP transporter large permease n=1 Tax=Thalassospira sp. TaxID=1912094 RepID=UPI000E806B8B